MAAAGVAIGATMMWNGVDNMRAGSQTIYGGHYVPTATNQALQNVGMSPQTAGFVEAVASTFVGAVGGSFVGKVATPISNIGPAGFRSNVGDSTNVVNGKELSDQLRQESARSPSLENGRLREEVIANSRILIKQGELNNPEIPQGFGKYATPTFQSPSGNFQVHFYKNSDAGKIFYDLDYKVKFNHGSFGNMK